MIRYFFCLAISFFLTIYYAFLLDFPTLGIDDANIYFTYAKNLSEGHGLVYNVSGERVEGFTSILWMLICSLCYWISPSNFTFLLLGINILIMGGILYLILSLYLRWNQIDQFFSYPVLLFFTLFALTPGFFDWNVITLMETGLWTLTLTAIFYFTHQWIDGNRQAFFCLVLMIPFFMTTRPESIAWIIFLTLIIGIINYYQQKRGRQLWLFPSLILLCGIIIIGCITVWRLTYFGYPLPNTYYAKVSTDYWYNFKEGIQYLGWFLLKIRISIIAFALLPLAIWIGTKKWELEVQKNIQLHQLTTVAFIGCGLVIPMINGGDHFLLSRFYQPIIPMLLIFLVYYRFWLQGISISFISILINKGFKVYSWLAFTGVLFLGFTPLLMFHVGNKEEGIQKEFEYVTKSRQLATNLELFFSDLKTLPYTARQAVGGFGFFYTGKVLDVYGLNDTEIAHASTSRYGIKNHASFDVNTFLQKQPDLFSFNFIKELKNPKQTTKNQKSDIDPLKGLYSNSSFKSKYKKVIIRKKTSGLILYTFASNIFLNQLLLKPEYTTEEINY